MKNEELGTKNVELETDLRRDFVLSSTFLVLTS